jgi:hypothetical protein
MWKRIASGLLLVGVLAFASGCSNNSTSPVSSNNTATDQFGSYTTSPESPAFGDPYLTTASSDEQTYNDPIAASPGVDSLAKNPDAGFYHLRIVWGKLEYDSTVTTPTDWSGSLSVTRGVELLRRVIRFENGQDYIQPRTDRKSIEWVSQTTVHNDGIGVDIIVPPMPPQYDTTMTYDTTDAGDTVVTIVVDTTLPPPVQVSFQTGPYSRTFTLDELHALDTIVYLDDSNAVAFNSYATERIPCPHGFLTGIWGTNDSGQQVFRGMWMSRAGLITGYVKGTYESNDSTGNTFVGKWIDNNGLFQGFIGGTWGPRPNFHANPNAFKHAGGWFKGYIYDATRSKIGALNGKFRESRRTDVRKGYLQGHWKLFCPDDFGRGQTPDDMDNDYGRGND